jgi:hypothetical protein
MIAGPLSEAKEVAFACESAVSDVSTLTEGNLPGRIRRAVRRYVANKFLSDHYGLTYDEFLTNGRARLGDTLRKIFSSVRFLDPPEVQILFCGWLLDREAFIIAVYDHGFVRVEESYAVIGSGKETAELMLYLRSPRAFMSTDEAAYTVYEAQRIGANARDVGFNANSLILEYDLRQHCIVTRNVKGPPKGFLDEFFKQQKPLPLPNGFRLESSAVDHPSTAQRLIKRRRIHRPKDTP